jgi:hypothetical protein
MPLIQISNFIQKVFLDDGIHPSKTPTGVFGWLDGGFHPELDTDFLDE